MKIEIIMPQMGESIAEGTIIKWWKQPGDMVEKDEILFEISTDKVDTEIPSSADGILTEIVIPEGETVSIGTVLGYIETETDKAEVKTQLPDAKKEKIDEPAKDSPAKGKKQRELEESEEIPSAYEGKKRFYSPVVVKIAGENDISLSQLETIQGSGVGGRITKKDIIENIERLKPADTAAAPVEKDMETADQGIDYDEKGQKVVPMDNMRLKIAEHMVHSVKTSPHVSVVSEVDMTGIVKYKDKKEAAFIKKEGFSLNITAFIAKALVMAIQDFPILNSSLDGKNIIFKKNINLGIAVAIEKGLLVPVVRNSEEKNLVGLARSIYDLSTRSRTKKLLPEEVMHSTISITNFGVFGNLFGAPIINQPNAAILGVGAVKKRPVVINDAIAIRDMMYLSLSFDHRVIDGATGGQFLERIVKYLEDVDTLVK
ncbi:dihydrolipoamide acetyltransferase family protein [candidate division KSB1 bacterium]